MDTALFPGTFDPPTLGHLDIIRRAAPLVKQLYVGISSNLAKRKEEVFSLEERREMLIAVTRDIPSIKIEIFSELTIDFAKRKKVDALVRGLRSSADLETEFQLALANRKLSGIETLFLMADPATCHISSTLIKEIASHKKRLTDFVPAELEEQIFRRLIK
jgi:pantetheine-phosphate adenylyltransferase